MIGSHTMPFLYDWLNNSALPLWWNVGADRNGGGFFEAIDKTGRPVASSNKRARVIGRQIYVYATATKAGLEGPWREAAAHGLDFMTQRFLRPDGLIRSTVTASGEPVDDAMTLYDQAFCLFGQASAAAIGLDPDARLAASERLHDRLLADWRGPTAGFVERDAHPFQANAHMHLFEASLAWEELTGGARWSRQADEIGELALARFIDAKIGALLEFYDAEWRVAAGEDGRLIEPGHLFEWSWLMMRWAKARGREDAAVAARRLFAVGVGHGVDSQRGVAVDAINPDLVITSARARLWPQTERIKAAVILAQFAETEAERETLKAEAQNAAAGLAKYLQHPVVGAWWDKMLPDGGFLDEPAPASSFYHIACAILDAKDRGCPV